LREFNYLEKVRISQRWHLKYWKSACRRFESLLCYHFCQN